MVAIASRGVDDGSSHAFAVIDVFTKDDGLCEGISRVEKLHDPAGQQFGALVKDQNVIQVF